jgi:hypothetical protein
VASKNWFQELVPHLPPLVVVCGACGNTIDVNQLLPSRRRCPLCMKAVLGAVDAAVALR